MRPWDEIARRSPGPPDEEALADLARQGIRLDPVPEGHHRHGDEVHVSDHTHPHRHASPGEMPSIGIVGAGSVGTALGVALARADCPVVAVASRDAGRRTRFRDLVGPGVRAFAEATAVLDEAELVFLAVPDDALPSLAGELRLYSGQALVHTSGALGADVLEPAMAAGTQVGAFHPLVSFSDLERSVAALHGATIAIEGDDQLADLLGRLAEAIGAVPVRLAAGAKPAYHAAAMLAAGGVIALLDAVAELGRIVGLDEAGSLAVFGRLTDQTIANARAIGIQAALTGPMVRGDVGTLRRHLVTLALSAPGVLPIYRATAAREIDLAVARGSIAPETAERLRATLASTP